MDSDDLTQDINLVFNGIDGAEAESFINSVQQAARTEGRSRDNEWIVDLVSTCVKGEALRWYVELDEDTQNDWKLLRKAILRQWPSRAQASAPSLPPTIPIPAAAPQPSSSISLPQSSQVSKPTRRIRVKLPPPRPPNPRPLMQQTPNSPPVYRIRLYFSDTKSDLFLSTDDTAHVCLTKSTAKALNVRWTTGNELQLVENDPKTQRMIWMIWYLPGSDGRSPGSPSDISLLYVSGALENTPPVTTYSGATEMISWILDKDGWLQSYSTVNQTRHQNQFYTSPGGSEGSLVRACLPPGLETWNIQRIRVFTMKLETI